MRAKLLLAILVLAGLACGQSANTTRRTLELYPSPLAIPTQTARVIVLTQTPNPTQTAVFLTVSETPLANVFCVSANSAVYLRPSANDTGYPIMPLTNGTIVQDLGGRSNGWIFVSVSNSQGWVNGQYLKNGSC